MIGCAVMRVDWFLFRLMLDFLSYREIDKSVNILYMVGCSERHSGK